MKSQFYMCSLTVIIAHETYTLTSHISKWIYYTVHHSCSTLINHFLFPNGVVLVWRQLLLDELNLNFLTHFCS